MVARETTNLNPQNMGLQEDSRNPCTHDWVGHGSTIKKYGSPHIMKKILNKKG